MFSYMYLRVFVLHEEFGDIIKCYYNGNGNTFYIQKPCFHQPATIASKFNSRSSRGLRMERPTCGSLTSAAA